jgi:hypothetical protein
MLDDIHLGSDVAVSSDQRQAIGQREIASVRSIARRRQFCHRPDAIDRQRPTERGWGDRLLIYSRVQTGPDLTNTETLVGHKIGKSYQRAAA